MQVEDVQCKGKDAAGGEILEVYIKQLPALALLTQVKADIVGERTSWHDFSI